MLTSTEIAHKLKSSERLLRSVYKVDKLYLFGSVARSTATSNSDADILVDFAGPATLAGFMGLKFQLEKLLNCPVDLVTRKALRPELHKTIMQEAIRAT